MSVRQPAEPVFIIDGVEYKKCSGKHGCGQVKPLTDFGIYPRKGYNKRYIRTCCRFCDQIRKKPYRLAESKRYKAKHPERVTASKRRQRKRGREQLRNGYIKALIVTYNGIRRSDVPGSLIGAYRQRILFNRELNKQNKEQTTNGKSENKCP